MEWCCGYVLQHSSGLCLFTVAIHFVCLISRFILLLIHKKKRSLFFPYVVSTIHFHFIWISSKLVFCCDTQPVVFNLPVVSFSTSQHSSADSYNKTTPHMISNICIWYDNLSIVALDTHARNREGERRRERGNRQHTNSEHRYNAIENEWWFIFDTPAETLCLLTSQHHTQPYHTNFNACDRMDKSIRSS